MRLFHLPTVRRIVAIVGMATLVAATAAAAQDAKPEAAATAPSAASGKPISVQLNKLETNKNSCRAYMVVNNETDAVFKSMKLELVMFRTDGIIGRRVAVELAPVRAQKRSVKIFELDGITCDQIGSFLINDVLECSAQGGDDVDCLSKLAVSSLSKVELSK